MGRAEGDTELVAPLVDCPLQKGSVGAETDVRTQEKPLPTAEGRAWHGPSRHGPSEAPARQRPGRRLSASSLGGSACCRVRLCFVMAAGAANSPSWSLTELVNRRGKKKSQKNADRKIDY